MLIACWDCQPEKLTRLRPSACGMTATVRMERAPTEGRRQITKSPGEEINTEALLPVGERRVCLFSVGYGHPDELGIHPDCWGGDNNWAMAAMLENLRVAVSKRIEEFEPIARSRTGVLTFSLVTSDSLHKVLSPAFLDRFSTSGLRKFDRIQVNADCQGVGERAMLLVEEKLEGKVKVRKL